MASLFCARHESFAAALVLLKNVALVAEVGVATAEKPRTETPKVGSPSPTYPRPPTTLPRPLGRTNSYVDTALGRLAGDDAEARAAVREVHARAKGDPVLGLEVRHDVVLVHVVEVELKGVLVRCRKRAAKAGAVFR